MTKPFFVMLYHPNENIGFVPMLDENDDLARFVSVKEADSAAKTSLLGSEFGWEVFQIGIEE